MVLRYMFPRAHGLSNVFERKPVEWGSSRNEGHCQSFRSRREEIEVGAVEKFGDRARQLTARHSLPCSPSGPKPLTD